jgi:hypothetical protein
MILYSRWCALSLDTRHKIASAFGIPKKGSTEVVSNQIKSDGFSVEDIEKALTVESIQDYLKSGFTDKDDLASLWDKLLAQIESGIEPGVEKAKTEAVSVLPAAEAKQFKKEHKARVKTAKASEKKAKTNTKKNAKAKN